VPDRVIDIQIRLRHDASKPVIELSGDLAGLGKAATQAVGPLDKAGKEMDEAGQNAEKGSRGLKLMDGAMMAVGTKVANLATQLPGMAWEMVQLGASAEAVEQRFTAFAGGTAQANAYLAAFQDAADGTVPRLDAMAGASKLLQMQLVSNADEMKTVTAIAVRLGDQTMAAGDRIGDFAALLANQSIPRLDNFGISSGRVRARIDELLKSGQAVSREEAFKMAVMEEGAKALEVLGDTAELTATRLDRAKATIADFKVSAAEAVIESKAFGDVLDSLDWRSLQAEFTRTQKQMVDYGLLTEDAAEATYKEIYAIGGLIVSKREQEEQVEALKAAIQEYNAEMDEHNRILAEAVPVADGWARKGGQRDGTMAARDRASTREVCGVQERADDRGLEPAISGAGWRSRNGVHAGRWIRRGGQGGRYGGSANGRYGHAAGRTVRRGHRGPEHDAGYDDELEELFRPERRTGGRLGDKAGKRGDSPPRAAGKNPGKGKN